MTPTFKSLPSFIKDSNHALDIFRTFSFSGENKIIFTMGITSLYTVIPNNEGLQALKYFLNQSPVEKPSSETLFRLASELVLTLNCFSFDYSCYKQINGVAIGTKMGPSYVNLFVENEFFSNYNGTKPDLYKPNVSSMTASVLLHPAKRNSTNIHKFSRFFPPGSKIHLGNFRKFSCFPRH